LTAKRRVYVSMPGNMWLDEKQNAIKWGIVDQIEKAGHEAQFFGGESGGRGLAAGKGWTLDECRKVMRRCVGAAIIGFPKWHCTRDGQNFHLPTASCHHEAAVAHTLGLPLLTIAEDGLEEGRIFSRSSGLEIVHVPGYAGEEWLNTPMFQGPFANWRRNLDRRRDVFLGYASSSTGLARNLKGFLGDELRISVLDWHTDFAPARSILQQIEEAAARCSAGIFLFTKDDNLIDDGEVGRAVPRDNVVFEAGYFSHAKGKDRVLIIREEGAKMPADLGGDVYAPLLDKADLSSAESSVRKFIEKRL
jgi:hypothetical protein